MEELLRQGEFLEFFIEGQRTRSGKAVYPKAGLLSVVVDALTNGMLFSFNHIIYLCLTISNSTVMQSWL